MEDIALGLIIIGIVIAVYFREKDKNNRNIGVILTIVSLIMFGIVSSDDPVDSKEEDINLLDSDEVEEVKEVETENDILFGDAHPYYGGSFDDAEQYSKRFDKGLVSFKNNGYSEDSIIHIGLIVDDVIKSLEIYPGRTGKIFNESDALDLVKEYLPKEEMLEKYEEPEFSKYLTEKEPSKVNKLIHYSSKEDAENTLGSINIILYEEDDEVKTIQMTSQKPNAVSVRPTNSLIKEEWNNSY